MKVKRISATLTTNNLVEAKLALQMLKEKIRGLPHDEPIDEYVEIEYEEDE